MNAGYEKTKEKLAAFNRKEAEEARERYEQEQRKCKECSSLLTYEKWKSRNVFCDHHCSALWRNKNTIRIKKLKPLKSKKTKDITALLGVTKGELFAKRKNWQSARSAIRRNAEAIFKRDHKVMACAVPNCSYSNHIEIAHIRSVSSFSGETLISEINAPDNLVGLCPNHHWDFDHGLLKL